MYGIYSKFNQVTQSFIHLTQLKCVLNIMVLSQTVIQIFCSQCPLWLKCLSRERVKVNQIFNEFYENVNQVVYIMYPNCMPEIAILAEVVLYVVKVYVYNLL